jgi:cobyrinic acid a,c-diamide synthase
LHLPGEQNNIVIVDCAAELIEEHIDIDYLLSQCHTKALPMIEKAQTSKGLVIAVAQDEAFNFSYPANIDVLNKLGKVSYFSPLNDKEIPDCDLVWLPGGYPELFAKSLSNNTSIITSIKKHIDNNKALIAECGGLMYLGKSIVDKDGKQNNMANVFDIETSFENAKLHLGYRKIKVNDFIVKGHEFHYSKLNSNSFAKEYEVKTARERKINMPVFRYKNCWASYMHIYLGEEQKMKLFLTHLNIKIEE